MARSLLFLVSACGVFAVYALLGSTPASAEPLGVDTMAAPPVKPTPEAPKVTEFEEALKAFNSRDIDGATRWLEKAVKNHPELSLSPAHILLAQLFARANQPAALRTALEKAVINSPSDPEAYVIMGDFALQDHRVTEADLLYGKGNELLQTFTKSAERKKALEPRTLSGLASVAEAREDWPLAEKDLKALLVLNPKDTMVLQRLGRARFQQLDATDCLKRLREAYELDKKNVLTPEATLARFYEQLGGVKNHKEAVKWMNIALDKAPEDLQTRLFVARWAMETGQVDEARKHAEKALQIDPKSLDAKVLRGIVALFQKKYEAAEADFAAVHDLAPANFVASNNLALALCEEKDDLKKSRALQFAEINARQFPKMVEAASTYGWVLYRLGKADEAEQALRTAASSGSLTPDTAYYLAQVFSDHKELARKKEAKAMLMAILKEKRPFSMRPEAEKLLETLNKELPDDK
jgi:tetratricopeptide (TPR) repeat protein